MSMYNLSLGISKSDFQIINDLILEQLNSDIPLIKEVAHYILNSGGKRLRPALVLIGAQLFKYQGFQHYELAAIIEMIHTATLLHDDVVDDSRMRRGRVTANQLFGNVPSILVGDFLYSRAFQMMVKIENFPILKTLADASNTIAEGEVMQMTFSHNPCLSEAQYLDTIRRKTAALFEASAQMGALLCQRSKEDTLAIAQYGQCMGMAFQLIDDALDYGAKGNDIGKNLGDDLAEGKVTLPLIRAMRVGNEQEKLLIENSITKGSIESLSDIIKIFASTDAIEYTYNLAKQYVRDAINTLQRFPACSARQALENFALLAVERNF